MSNVLGELKLVITMLLAQKSGIEEQLRLLRQILCPECNGQKWISYTEPDPDVADATRLNSEECKACNGTGYACGEEKS